MSAVAAVAAAALVSGAVRAQESVTYQLNPARTGATEFPRGFDTPLRQAWSRKFPFQVSYPVIAEGKAFVLVGDNHLGPPFVSTLHALDLRTGQTLWSKRLPNTYYWPALTYASGRLFAINAGDLVRAYDPASGAQLWSARLGGGTSIPNVGHGVLYFAGYNSGSWLFAINQATGKLARKKQVTGGPSPVVAKTAVLLANECTRRSMDPQTGNTDWFFYIHTGCSSTEVAAPFHNDRLYVRRGVGAGRDFHSVVDVFEADTGKKQHTLPASAGIYAPVVDGDTVYLTTYWLVTARSATTREALWQYRVDNAIAVAPILVNGKLIVLQWTGELLVLDGTTGALLQSLSLRDEISYPTSYVPQGFGAGQGMLLVPAGDELFALKGAR